MRKLWAQPNGPMPAEAIHMPSRARSARVGLVWVCKQACKTHMLAYPSQELARSALQNVVADVRTESSSKAAFCRNMQRWSAANTATATAVMADPASVLAPGVLPCFDLPAQRAAFEAHAAAHPARTWIWKPDCASSGVGVLLGTARHTRGMPPRKYAHAHNGSYSGAPVVVQQLVPMPLLIGGHKMDLRLYCLVFFDPVGAPRVYLHRNGGVKVAEAAFEPEGQPSPSSVISNFQADASHPPAYKLRRAISEQAGLHGAHRWAAIWAKVEEAVAHAVLGVGPRLGCRNPRASARSRAVPCGRTFQLFGIDVVVDGVADTAHVMEINSDPGMYPWMSEVRNRWSVFGGAKRPAHRMYEEVYVDLLAAIGYAPPPRDMFEPLAPGEEASRMRGLRCVRGGRRRGVESCDAGTADFFNASLRRDTTGFALVFPTTARCADAAVTTRLEALYAWPLAKLGRAGGTCANLYGGMPGIASLLRG